MSFEHEARAARERALVALMPEMMGLALRLTRDRSRAEDAAQETLLGVWSRLTSGAEIEDLRAYTLASLRHRCRRRAVHGADLPLDETTAGTAATGDDALALGSVLGAMLRLPREQADLVRRVAVAGQSYREIASETGLPIGTVMSRVARARARLRGELKITGAAVPKLL